MLVSLFIAALRGLARLAQDVRFSARWECSPHVSSRADDGLYRLASRLDVIAYRLECRQYPWSFRPSGRNWQRYCQQASDARMIAAIFDERFPPASELAAKVRRESIW